MSGLTRRTVVKGALAAGVGAMSPLSIAEKSQKSVVYWTPELSGDALLKMYKLVDKNIKGKVAIKLHTGEPEGPNILPREWVKQFQAAVPNSTIVECNVLYDSPRKTTEGHRKVLQQNGWTFCPVDIMDEDGDMVLPVKGGLHLKEFNVGKNFGNYDSMIVLTHFKGHTLGGFGGSLKNIAIGCGSGKVGKQQLHRLPGDGTWPGGAKFMELMADGGKAIIDHFGPKIVYVNVLRNMSVSCDCEGKWAKPVTLPNLGIMASTDLLAIDKACIDMIYALPDFVKKDMVERIESREGLRQLSAMQELGMGNPNYEIVRILPEKS